MEHLEDDEKQKALDDRYEERKKSRHLKERSPKRGNPQLLKNRRVVLATDQEAEDVRSSNQGLRASLQVPHPNAQSKRFDEMFKGRYNTLKQAYTTNTNI